MFFRDDPYGAHMCEVTLFADKVCLQGVRGRLLLPPPRARVCPYIRPRCHDRVRRPPLCRVPGPQVKDGESMRQLWSDAENHTDFLDFSPVFTHDKDRGWAHVREER